MPAFPGTVRVAGTLSATNGAVIVTDDRLSLQAGEDNLGDWSLDTLAVVHKGQAITISIDDEIVVFTTSNADQLVEAVQAGARRAAEAAEIRNDRIKRTKRPRIGRKATTKRKIEMFEEQQRHLDPLELTGVTAEPGADPWLDQITVAAPVLNPDDAPVVELEPPDPSPPASTVATIEAPPIPEPAEMPVEVQTPAPDPEVASSARRSDEGDAPRLRRRAPRLRPSMIVAVAAVAGIVAAGVFFRETVSMVTLGIAAVAIMVAIAGIMDQTIELRLPNKLSVTRLFILGLALLAASTALTMLA